MKKKLLIILLSTITISSYAYNLNITTQGFSDGDTVSIAFSAQKGDCRPSEFNLACQKVQDNTDGLDVNYLNEFLDLYKSGYEDYILTELSFKINDQSFSSCQHLQTRGQNLSIIITPGGCV